jgi:hypothetical protein
MTPEPKALSSVAEMARVEVQWRVFSGAYDELNLWELPGRHVYVEAGRTKVSPDLPIGEVRRALIEAVVRGLVELYDQDVEGYPVLRLSEALAVAGDDDEWSAESASRRVALSITEAGVKESHSVFERLRSASPFRATGARDPQDFS